MAFYHVNGCDCPIGCCDCGEVKKSPKQRKREKFNLEAYELIKEMDVCPSCYYSCKLCMCGVCENGS